MKLINVVITRCQQTEILVPDDYDLHGNAAKHLTQEHWLYLDRSKAADESSPTVYVELLQEGL